MTNKNIKIDNLIDDNISAISQQVNSSYSNGISGIGIRNKKKETMYEYNNLKIIRKIIYISIPIILLFFIVEFIFLKALGKSSKNELDLFIQFREFYSLYFKIFLSILSIVNIRLYSSQQSLLFVYAYNNYMYTSEYFDFQVYIKGQSQLLVEDIIKQREYLVKIHNKIGNNKYNEIFCQNVDYYRISQNSTDGIIKYYLTKGKVEFSEALLIIFNSFQSITNCSYYLNIFIINKLNDDPFALLNSNYNYNQEINQYQKDIYEMIMNFKIYRQQLNNINQNLYDLLLESNYKKFKLAILLLVSIDNLFMLFISCLLYAYLLFFEIILMKILNFINMTININKDKFNFSHTFSQKIDNLETLLKIYKEDPVKCVRNINKIYNKYQQYLTAQNKNNMNEMNKRGYKKMINNENKKSEMDNIPKNQRIVSKKDIRNLHLISSYLISLMTILIIFLGSYTSIMLMWINHFKRQNDLYILIKKDFKLESAIYDAISIYDLMIFQNYTLDEVDEYIFRMQRPLDKKPKGNAEILNKLYEDLELAFNNKEKNKLNDIYSFYDRNLNFTCDFLYNYINQTIETIENRTRNPNIKENLIKICENERYIESNDIISIFEYHFQNIKNGILSIEDFSYIGITRYLNNQLYPGKINIFFNCVIIYTMDFIFNRPHMMIIKIFNYSFDRNFIITAVNFIVLDFLIISIILFFYIANIKHYCNQIVLLKKVFKINEIQEQ